MPGARRRALVRVVEQDARREGVSPAVVLAALLGVEEDPDIARAIFAAMEAAGGEGLCSRAGSRALLAGADEAGAAVLVRPLYGAFVELFALSWDASGIRSAIVEPLLEMDRVEEHLTGLPEARDLQETHFARAVQRVTDVLWAHVRRHGQLPGGVEPFAELL